MPGNHYCCNICNKSFTHATNMYRHKKGCKGPQHTSKPATGTTTTTGTTVNITLEMFQAMIKRQEEMSSELRKVKEELNALKAYANVQKHQTHDIVELGMESLEHVSQNYITFCVMNKENGMVDLIKAIYLSPKQPKNHNLRLQTMDNCDTIMYFDGKTWVQETGPAIFSTLIKTTKSLMMQHFTDHEEWFPVEIKPEIEAFLQCSSTSSIETVCSLFQNHWKDLGYEPIEAYIV